MAESMFYEGMLGELTTMAGSKPVSIITADELKNLEKLIRVDTPDRNYNIYPKDATYKALQDAISKKLDEAVQAKIFETTHGPQQSVSVSLGGFSDGISFTAKDASGKEVGFIDNVEFAEKTCRINMLHTLRKVIII